MGTGDIVKIRFLGYHHTKLVHGICVYYMQVCVEIDDVFAYSADISQPIPSNGTGDFGVSADASGKVFSLNKIM